MKLNKSVMLGNPLKEKCLRITVTLNLQILGLPRKHGVCTLQLPLGAPLKTRYFTH